MNQDIHMLQGYQLRPQLSPCLVHSMQLLSMPYMALVPFLQKMTLENPFLEVNVTIEELLPDVFGSKQKEDSSFSSISDWTISDSDYLETEKEILRLELLICGYPEEIERAALVILGELDTHGYWMGSTEELANRFHITEETASRALEAVQKLKPAGIGARNLRECLVLQVDERLENAAIIRRMIEEDLMWVAENSFQKMRKKYLLSLKQAQKITAYIRSLNPYPLDLGEKQRREVYVYPEMSVHCKGNVLEAVLIQRSEQILLMNKNYISDFEGCLLDTAALHFVRSCKNSAQDLLNSLKMRDHTMRRVLEEIVGLQKAYFMDGPQSLKPMTLKQIADNLKINTSTVFRCVQDKYIETDFGVVPLKSLFTTSVKKTDGDVVSSAVVKAAVHKILEKEGQQGYSDRQLTELLSEQGICVSRRTVTKYRNAEKICNRSKRRKYRGQTKEGGENGTKS